MSGSTNSHSPQLAQLSAISVDFERAWQSGERPRIEEFLLRVEPSSRGELLRKLVQIERAWLGSTGELSADFKDEYLRRFPELSTDFDFETSGQPASEQPAPEQVQVNCPQCGSTISIHQSGTPSVSCSSCGHSFTVTGGSADQNTLQVVGGDAAPTEFAARFQLLMIIGQGAFGAVWKAWDAQLQRYVALKLPHVENLAPKLLAEFLRDASAAAQLDHPQIVRVFDVTRIDSQMAIVSELVDGTDLKTWLAKHKSTLKFRTTAELIAKIALALQHAHSRGVIHRDLKPGNVMLTRDLQPKVIDFGLARRESSEATIATPGAPLGTPAYMPPEQASGAGSSADGRADVYSLGIMLYEMLTGEIPFRGSTVSDVLTQQIHHDPPAPTQINSRIPPSLETICMKCLRKEPGRRFQSAQQVADELQRYLDGKPILSRPVGWVERFWMLCRRNPFHSAGYGSAVAALVVILVLSFLHISNARDQEHIAKVRAEGLAEHNLKLADAEKQSRREAETRRDQAIARLTDARDAVDLWLTTIGERLRFVPGMTREREQLLQLAEQDYAKFSAQASDDPDLELERGRVLLRLGQVRRGLRKQEALDAFTAARELFDRLSQSGTSPPLVTQKARLGWCDATTWLGLLALDAGELDQADGLFQEAANRLLQVRQKQGSSTAVDESLALAWFNRGALLLKKGQLSQARPLIEQANQLFSELRHVNRTSRRLDALAAAGLELLATADRDAGQLPDAERLMRSASDILADLVKAEPANLDWLAQHGRAQLQLASIMQQSGKELEELACIEGAIRDYEAITREHPDLVAVQQDLAISLIDAARLRLAQGFLAEAGELLDKVEPRLELLREPDAPGAVVEQLLAHVADVRGQVLTGLGQTELGLARLEEACDRFGQLVQANADVPEFQASLALAQLHHAQGLEQETADDVTRDAYAQAVATADALPAAADATPEQRYVAAYIVAARADYLQRKPPAADEAEAAARLLETETARADKLWRNLIDSGSATPDQVLEYCKFRLNHAALQLRDPALALDLLERLKTQLPENATVFQLRGLAMIRRNQFDQAADSIQTAIRLRGEPQARDLYCQSLAQSGMKQPAPAQMSFDQAAAWQQDHAPQLAELLRLKLEAQTALTGP